MGRRSATWRSGEQERLFAPSAPRTRSKVDICARHNGAGIFLTWAWNSGELYNTLLLRGFMVSGIAKSLLYLPTLQHCFNCSYNCVDTIFFLAKYDCTFSLRDRHTFLRIDRTKWILI